MTETMTAAPWRLRSRLGRFFLGLGIGFVVLATVVVVAVVLFVRAGNDVIDKWGPASAASSRMFGDLVNQETGLRGYLLTGQEASLEPYTQYQRQQKIDTAQLRRLTGGDAKVDRLVDAFDRSASEWQRRVARPLINQTRAGRLPGSGALDRGKARFDDIRRRSTTLLSALDDRATDARHQRFVEGVVAAVALGLLLLALALVALRLWQGLHRRVLMPIEDLGAQTRRVASGELDHNIRAGGPGELVDLGADIEGMRAQIVNELARAEDISEDLRRQGAELERSNADLQQFAYVASHDLSEPLRKVANFCQLIERQYGPQLDDRGRQYIWFAVDGAKRMQALINDLLALSRVGRTTDTFEQIDLDAKLDQAIANLGEQITATGATIERLTPLPTIEGDRALMISLLQNLIGNAIKYHRDDVPPIVRIGAERDGKNWLIRVSDNGIGIDPQYADRIFAVFQRLHLRDQYGGTGIGLALCRRIVDFHGGRIRLDTPDPGEGAAFVFSLPEGQHRARSDDE